jgi:hypothetical protein
MTGFKDLPAEMHLEIAKHLRGADEDNLDAMVDVHAASLVSRASSDWYQVILLENVVLIDHIHAVKLLRTLIEQPKLRKHIKTIRVLYDPWRLGSPHRDHVDPEFMGRHSRPPASLPMRLSAPKSTNEVHPGPAVYTRAGRATLPETMFDVTYDQQMLQDYLRFPSFPFKA